MARRPLAQGLESPKLRMERTCFPGIYNPPPPPTTPQIPGNLVHWSKKKLRSEMARFRVPGAFDQLQPKRGVHLRLTTGSEAWLVEEWHLGLWASDSGQEPAEGLEIRQGLIVELTARVVRNFLDKSWVPGEGKARK